MRATYSGQFVNPYVLTSDFKFPVHIFSSFGHNRLKRHLQSAYGEMVCSDQVCCLIVKVIANLCIPHFDPIYHILYIKSAKGCLKTFNNISLIWTMKYIPITNEVPIDQGCAVTLTQLLAEISVSASEYMYCTNQLLAKVYDRTHKQTVNLMISNITRRDYWWCSCQTLHLLVPGHP